MIKDLRFTDPKTIRTENIRVPEDDPRMSLHPTASLYLGLRAARRALAHNPNDARTHLVLGQIYLALLLERPEGVESRNLDLLQPHPPFRGGLPPRARRSNSTPDLTQGHELLCSFTSRLGMIDLATKHFGEFCRCTARDGSREAGGLRETAG